MIPPEFTLRHLETVRRFITNIARRRCLHMNPRRWSNAELRKLAPFFGGDVVNVSGFMDEDKEGGHYRDYFTAAESYTITNYAGSGEVGDGSEGSIYLDLEGTPSADFQRRFDTAFCHTVLEHVEKIGPAFENLSHLTRDALIIVVPFLQDEHYRPGIFGDYWRYTPLGLKALYEAHGFQMVYLNANDTPWYPVYLTAVGVRDPGKYPELPASPWTPEQRVGRQTYVYPKGVW
ncbi:MAG: hypothetical protein JJU29_07665 [Verrucomicrobia bacterium]|nr:hypothetical protein [Verrucomicrobiota bacterium]